MAFDMAAHKRAALGERQRAQGGAADVAGEGDGPAKSSPSVEVWARGSSVAGFRSTAARPLPAVHSPPM
jgi:hypothetical protein